MSLKRKKGDEGLPKVATKKKRGDDIPIRVFTRPPLEISKVATLDDLLDVAWNYKGSEDPRFDWTTLWLLIPVLTDLKGLTGMDELKGDIVSLVMYHLQNPSETARGNTLHTFISGPPGCGKTRVVKILAKIYRGLDILPTERVSVAKRDDFTGSLANKNAKDWIDKATGGVLFVDEVMSIGGMEKGCDNFLSALDVLNDCLSDTTRNLVCIVAGNESEVEKYLFFASSGLRSNFLWHFPIRRYSAEDLLRIFKTGAKESGWQLEHGAINKIFFVENSIYFPAYARDLSRLLELCKISHTVRTFLTSSSRILSKADIVTGFERYKTMKREHKTTLVYYG